MGPASPWAADRSHTNAGMARISSAARLWLAGARRPGVSSRWRLLYRAPAARCACSRSKPGGG
jgi:hypothetical protein